MKQIPWRGIAPRSVLVVVTRRIGDVLLATPLLRSLRVAWSKARIDVLVFRGTEGILAANRDISHVLAVPERPGLLQQAKLAVLLLRRYDLAVSLLPGDRPTFYAWLAGRYRIAPVEPAKSAWIKRWMLSATVPFDNLESHTVLMNLRLADLLGIERRYEVAVVWSADDEARVRELLPTGFVHLSGPVGAARAAPTGPDFAMLHLYPMFAYKTWRKQGWVELANWLAGHGVRVVLTGGPSSAEQTYVEELLPRLPGNTLNLVGKLTLAQVGFLVSRARVYIGPDTALTHMAAALGIPTVALFGPSNPVKWGPWPKHYARNSNPYAMRGSQSVGNVILVQGTGRCVPCLGEGCEKHVNSLSDCLQHLSASRVIAAAEAALAFDTHRVV